MADTRAGRRSRYRLRKQVVEPVFGQIKESRGFTRQRGRLATGGRSPQARERYLPSIPSDTRHGPSRRQGICILHDTAVMIATLVMIAGINARGGEADAYCD
jgi:hypothetical protein